MSTIHLAGIRAIVFDLDDTLYLERSFAYSGFAAVANWLGERLTCPFDAAVRMRELFETEHRRHVFDQLLAELGCEKPEKLVPAMVECYRNHVPRIELLADAERALDRWRDFFLAIISDGPLNMQQRKIHALGLENRLNLVVLTDRWGPGYWKPNPRGFQFVEEQSGHRGSACVYIADNLQKDFVAPNRMGWRAIRLRRENGIHDAIQAATDGRPEFEVELLDQVDIR